MTHKFSSERLERDTFRHFEIQSIDGYAAIWVWGSISQPDEYEEYPIMTIGLDGIDDSNYMP